MTQFERVIKELDIDLIHARSIPAKGRGERDFGIDQDRLVKLMRLKDISTIDGANEFIQNYYLPKHKRKFAHPAQMKEDLHRPIKGFNLYDTFARKVLRIVQNDWTIQYENQVFQLDSKSPRVWSKDKIQVYIRLDGSIYMLKGNQKVKFKEIPKKLKEKNID